VQRCFGIDTKRVPSTVLLKYYRFPKLRNTSESLCCNIIYQRVNLPSILPLLKLRKVISVGDFNTPSRKRNINFWICTHTIEYKKISRHKTPVFLYIHISSIINTTEYHERFAPYFDATYKYVSSSDYRSRI